MKVLLSAFACEPGKGSELEVGFRAMLAASSRHDVWVLTLPDSVPLIREALTDQPHGSRIHLEGIDFGMATEQFPELSAAGFHWRYDRWQRAASARGRELDHRVDFDIAHHITLSGYWTRAGVADIRKPLV
jgi:hypothetical protein